MHFIRWLLNKNRQLRALNIYMKISIIWRSYLTYHTKEKHVKQNGFYQQQQQQQKQKVYTSRLVEINASIFFKFPLIYNIRVKPSTNLRKKICQVNKRKLYTLGYINTNSNELNCWIASQQYASKLLSYF